MTSPAGVDRRHVLAGTALGMVALTGCGEGSGPSTGSGYGGVPTSPNTSEPTGTTSPSEPTEPTDEPEPTKEPQPTEQPEVEGLVATADVPVGGGVILAGESLVVTQPERGTFRGFSSTCTHRGCTVSSVQGGTITCPCHGSQYSVADGSVTRGPATQGLPPRELTVTDGQITLA